jgi:flavin reductase (DIM6/NTAB) family NADH-FMN oxidoreductase RutF
VHFSPNKLEKVKEDSTMALIPRQMGRTREIFLWRFFQMLVEFLDRDLDRPHNPVRMDEYPADKVYRLVEPGPVVMVTTANRQGRKNIMTAGFHMMIQHDPPLIGIVVGPWDHSFAALRSTKECVIAIPTVDLATKVVDIGNCSGEDLDKFDSFDLTPLPASQVGAPLVKECRANIECRVVDASLVSKYNMFILRAVKAWVDGTRQEQRTFHHRGDGTFIVDGETLDLQDRMTKWTEYQD